jgi:hypothetical protein
MEIQGSHIRRILLLSNWLWTAIVLSRIRIWPIKSRFNQTGIRISNMDVGRPSNINFCNIVHHRKNLSLFSTVASQAPICPSQSQKMRCYKGVAVHVKTNPWTLVARRLFPRYATKQIIIGFRVVAKSAVSEEPVLHLWMSYTTVYGPYL